MNRSREEIVADILSVAGEPVKKTMIMYKAHLSFEQLKLYLDFSREKGLISNTEDGLWIATDKGRLFLSQYQLISAIIA